MYHTSSTGEPLYVFVIMCSRRFGWLCWWPVETGATKRQFYAMIFIIRRGRRGVSNVYRKHRHDVCKIVQFHDAWVTFSYALLHENLHNELQRWSLANTVLCELYRWYVLEVIITTQFAIRHCHRACIIPSTYLYTKRLTRFQWLKKYQVLVDNYIGHVWILAKLIITLFGRECAGSFWWCLSLYCCTSTKYNLNSRKLSPKREHGPTHVWSPLKLRIDIVGWEVIAHQVYTYYVHNIYSK